MTLTDHYYITPVKVTPCKVFVVAFQSIKTRTMVKKDTSDSKNNNLVPFYSNFQSSATAQTSLFSASYTIYGKNFLFVLET